MPLTKQQQEIINTKGNIKINAIAGSGKTSTMIAYAKTRPKNSKILYLAFNKSVKIEALKKFAEKGVGNVTVETAHSLAYKHIVSGSRYKLTSGYTTYEIVELLRLQGDSKKYTKYVIAYHIDRFIAYFCNSDARKVQELNYLDIVSDAKSKKFVSNFYTLIERKTRELLKKMNDADIKITHDFYLKKFQLSNPALHFDYILFDEGQDASGAMIAIFLKQPAIKVIVGDTHQQIYGWRFAINALEKVNFKTLYLSTSFRFGQDIANLATSILGWKKYIQRQTAFEILAKGEPPKKIKTKAVIARTNLGLLARAIKYVVERNSIKSIYFEGHIHSYTYAQGGASLYDILRLFNHQHKYIKDKLIANMDSFDELEEYVDKTNDMALGVTVEIVKKYGNEILKIIEQLKEKHIGKSENKENAEMIFSTVHRCKGMEYDAIEIGNDFISEKELKEMTQNNEHSIYEKLNEEINLLYVAVTRSKKSIHIPKNLMPSDFTTSNQIHIIKNKEKQESTEKTISTFSLKTKVSDNHKNNKEKAYSVKEIRKKYKNAYRPWTEKLDAQLTKMYDDGVSIGDIANHFDRKEGAIVSRLKKIGLIENDV